MKILLGFFFFFFFFFLFILGKIWIFLMGFYLFIYFSEELARKSKIYSYGRSFNGFAAKLLPHEAQKLASSSEFPYYN